MIIKMKNISDKKQTIDIPFKMNLKENINEIKTY